MNSIAAKALVLAGGGVFALAVAVFATQAATAAGIGLPTPASARIVGEGARSLDHGGVFGARVVTTAAAYIGITEEALRVELKAGKSLAEVAVANGKTRDGLIAALSAAASEAIGDLVDRKGLHGPGKPGPGRIAIMKSEPLEVASSYLGIPRADLAARVRAGETLAAIASATAGKSRDGLIAAIVAESTVKIDAAVTANRIGAEEATRLKSKLTEHATRLVDETRPLSHDRVRKP